MAKKATKASASEDLAKIKAVIAGLEKQYGKGVIQTVDGNAGMQRFARQVPSGSIALDLALGTFYRRPNGTWSTGYPDGRIVEFFGEEGTGKTTLCLLMIANAQAMGIRCAFMDMEHALDKRYAQALGVDLKTLQFSQPSSGQECLEIADTLLKSGLFGLIVVDSVAALVPESELAGEIGDASVGGQALLMSKALRSMNTHLTKTGCNLVFTNQMREKIGVTMGSNKTTPGGRALKFYAHIRIETWRGKKLTVAEGAAPYGQILGINVIKNKCAPPFRKAECDLVYGKGVDYVAELLDLAVGRNLLTANGAWYYNGEKPLGQGRRNATEELRQDPALCYTLYDKVMTASLAENGYQPDGTPIPGAMSAIPVPNTMVNTFRPVEEADEAEAIEAEAAA